MNRRFRIKRQSKKINLDGRKTRLRNDTKIISGNYNELISGNYIQGDCIHIQEKSIDISQDINQILVELGSILIKLENQGYSTEEAKAQIANELAEEVRRKPGRKSKLGFDEDADENDEAEALINILTDDNSYFANRKPSGIYTYLEEDDDDYEDRVSYKGHTIYLEVDKDGCWYYRIDGLISFDDTGHHYFKYFAIDEAKGKIDKERFSNW